ncbi:uncharacterized protein [Watersipora subatra]|uniref:uncharacterized protein n=1 Tax=Watersipora subatra TaxID=2589382 RepID=UPI00355C7777
MKLTNWPRISPRDGQGLREFGDFLGHLKSAMSSIKTLRVLDDYLENEKMVEKLPEWLKLKWIRLVAKVESTKGQYPDFQEFTQFINEEARIMTLPICQSLSNHANKPKERTSSTTSSSRSSTTQVKGVQQRERSTPHPRAIKSFVTTTESKKGCICCGFTNHSSSDCYRLQERTKPEKEEFIRKNGLCFKCLESGHRSRDCDKRLKCLKCKKGHATANHENNWTTSCNAGKAYGVKTLFGWTMCGGSIKSTEKTRGRAAYKANISKEIQLLSILERDFQETNEESYVSQEDMKFIKTLESSTIQNQAGNYIMPLPFKSELPKLPNNRKQALSRLEILLRKFSTNPKYQAEYATFIENLIEAGHAEEAPPQQQTDRCGTYPILGLDTNRSKNYGWCSTPVPSLAEFH